MAVNKVVYGSDTLIDLTEDTVTPDTLAVGATAHSANGERIVGRMSPGGGGGSVEVYEDEDGNIVVEGGGGSGGSFDLLADVRIDQLVQSVEINIPQTTKKFWLFMFVANKSDSGNYNAFPSSGTLYIKDVEGITAYSTPNMFATAHRIAFLNIFADIEHSLVMTSPVTKSVATTDGTILTNAGTYTNEYGRILSVKACENMGFTKDTFTGKIVITCTAECIGNGSRFVILGY